MTIDKAQILAIKAKLKLANQAFINGQYQAASAGKTFTRRSAIDGQVITEVASCDARDIDLACQAAKRSFVEGHWSNCSPLERKQVLLKFADLLESHCLSLAVLETWDVGKAIADSLAVDVPGSIARLRYIAEAIDKVYDRVAPTRADVLATITREPCGVVGIITPWNFPLFLALANIAPALAAGNSVVVKPAEQAPLTTLYIAQLAHEAGIPAGVLNVVPGMGETAGKALALHPDVEAIAFTGSTEVGKLMMQYSGQSNLKRVHLECGGKSPNIIMADAEDLTLAATTQAARVFFNQGQVCCAPTRLLVQNTVRESVIDEMKKVAQTFMPGDPWDPQTKVGALIDQVQHQRVLGYLAQGRASAELVCGGQATRQDSGGYYIEPTIFSGVKNDMAIAQEEIFGPVLSVIGFDTMAEAIALANDTTYGLAASVWTANLNVAHTMARQIRAGVVSVNCIDTGDPTTTFGGYRQSGVGTQGALLDFDNFSEIKTTWIQLGRP